MNSQTDESVLQWKNGKPDPSLVGQQQIILTAWNKELGIYEYNIVAYHADMDIWFGGPGVIVKTENIISWASIPERPAPPADPGN